MLGNTSTHWSQISTKSRIAKLGTELGTIPDAETESQRGHVAWPSSHAGLG